MKELRAKRKAAGCCPYCGQPLTNRVKRKDVKAEKRKDKLEDHAQPVFRTKSRLSQLMEK